MPVNAVSNQRENKTSYFFATTFGLACGYSAKWLLPLNKSEKDDEYIGKLKDIAKKTRATIHKEVDLIRETKPNGSDEFLSIYNRTAKEIKKPLPINVMELFTQVNEKASTFKQNELTKLKAHIKYIRPALPFVLIGGIIGFIYATVKNITSSNANA